MAINATVDGTTYEDVNKITTGGKEISLSYSGGGGGGDLPSGISEIKMGTYEPESDKSSTQTISHGCSSTPDIIIMWSDYKTYYTSSTKPNNTTMVAEYYNSEAGHKMFGGVATTYTGTDNPDSNTGAVISSENDGHITNVGSSSFDIKATGTRRLGGGLTYTWIAIVLA